MYAESARVYDLLTDGKDYSAASDRLMAAFSVRRPAAASLLDVGCGTGRHLARFATRYCVVGLDLSEQMLRVAAERCPGIALHQGDLRDFDLGQRFDIVTCLFGSLGYSGDEAGLHAAVARLAAHLHPGGLLAIEPWLSPERFIEGRLVFDRVTEGSVKVARMYVARREGCRSIYDIEYLVGTGQGISRFSERQVLGLFTDAQYQAAIIAAGLQLLEFDAGEFGYGLYLAALPAG